MLENIRLSFRGIFSHKMRSVLTMLGIIIGIAAIIAIVSTIEGTNAQIRKNLIGSGTNAVNVSLNQSDWEYDYSQGIPSGIPMVSRETDEQLRAIEHVQNVALYHKRQEYNTIYSASSSMQGTYIYGVDNNYLHIQNLVAKSGRLFLTRDEVKNQKVCLIDTTTESSLYPQGDAVGKTITIRNVPFVIVGVVTQKQGFTPEINTINDYYMYMSDQTGKIYVPSVCWPSIYQYDEPQSVLLAVDHTESMTNVGKDAETILNANLNTQDSSTKYKAEDLLKQAKDIQDFTQSANTMLIWIAGISLLVGGIGVMNIMLVSVTERTSEIGLKKAIGARKRAILTQFLTEAVVLTSLGGILGVIAGIILAEMISKLASIPVAISIPASVIAVVFSMLIGIIFGLIPSVKAANLDPIEALRHE